MLLFPYVNEPDTIMILDFTSCYICPGLSQQWILLCVFNNRVNPTFVGKHLFVCTENTEIYFHKKWQFTESFVSFCICCITKSAMSSLNLPHLWHYINLLFPCTCSLSSFIFTQHGLWLGSITIIQWSMDYQPYLELIHIYSTIPTALQLYWLFYCNTIQ